MTGMSFAQSNHINLDPSSTPKVTHAETATTVAPTKYLQIGDLWYNGTTTMPGGTTLESNYGLDMNAVKLTVAPIPFSNIQMFVLGGSAGTDQPVSTGPTCGTVERATAPPCQMEWSSGPGGLPVCGTQVGDTIVENCISIAIQLTSVTGKNFNIPLLNGQNFCAQGVTNVYLTTPNNELALDPGCNTVQEFCRYTVSAPIILREGAAGSCD
jgi:hypothetical protein